MLLHRQSRCLRARCRCRQVSDAATSATRGYNWASVCGRPREACSSGHEGCHDLHVAGRISFAVRQRAAVRPFHESVSSLRRDAAGVRWCPSIVDRVSKERQQYGETPPTCCSRTSNAHVADLRDVQMVRWIGFTRYGETDLENLRPHRVSSTTVDRMRLVASP